jgi:riboflavin kinase / FMN adenylyltransferase
MIIKNKIKSIAIGGFDGMHLAHQELFKKLGMDGAIIVICTGYANLTFKTYRAKHTDLPLFYYPLESIKHLSGEEFIYALRQEFPNLEKIVVGYDFHFGYKALQNTEDLQKIFHGEVVIVEEHSVDGVAIHSRIIREYLRDGKIEQANRLLGYNYIVEGYCIKGQGLGKKQFVPTLNIEVKEFLIPQAGIYATRTKILGKSYDSVSFIGHRLTTDGEFACETHILDEKLEIEDPHIIEIEFYSKLRDNKKFEQYEELKQQILEDIEMTKKYFAEVGKK